MLLESIYEKQLKELDEERKEYMQARKSVLESEFLSGETLLCYLSLFQWKINELDKKENEIIAKLEKLRGL